MDRTRLTLHVLTGVVIALLCSMLTVAAFGPREDHRLATAIDRLTDTRPVLAVRSESIAHPGRIVDRTKMFTISNYGRGMALNVKIEWLGEDYKASPENKLFAVAPGHVLPGGDADVYWQPPMFGSAPGSTGPEPPTFGAALAEEQFVMRITCHDIDGEIHISEQDVRVVRQAGRSTSLIFGQLRILRRHTVQ